MWDTLFIHLWVLWNSSPNKFLKSHGFSEGQTLKMVKIEKTILYLDNERDLLSVLEFFICKGASQPEIVKILVSSPSIFKRTNSLDRPFNNITNFLGCERMTLLAIISFSRILLVKPNRLNANKNAFLEFGVHEENIRNMLMKESRRLIVANNLLRASLEEVRN